MNIKVLFLSGVTCLGLAAPAFSMTDAECEQAFASADSNKDGVITQAEAARYFPAGQTDKTSMAKSDFMTQCRAGTFAEKSTDAAAAALLEGSNSFTESQAKNRIVAQGMTDVSALKKDDKGVWRGTAMSQGKSVNVGVDYKGNVVAN